MIKILRYQLIQTLPNPYPGCAKNSTANYFPTTYNAPQVENGKMNISKERGSECRISLLQQAIFLLHQKWLFSWSLLQHHYIKNGFLVDHYYDNQNVEKNIKIKTFDVLILPMASKKITTSKIKNINYLWHFTFGYIGLWGPGGLG